VITEEEARKKWCPFVRLLSVTTRDGKPEAAIASFNRIALSPDPSTHVMSPETARCIASECMAWRWAKVKDVITREPPPGHYEWVDSDVYGYCGLAGAP